jgi:hypothetical protein
MIFKSNNKLEEHIKNMMAKGLSNRGIVVNAGKNNQRPGVDEIIEKPPSVFIRLGL